MGRADAPPVDRVCSHHHAPAPPLSPPPLVTLAAGDVLLALNGVPTMGGEGDEESLGALAHKLLRLCYKTGTWVTVARPVGRVRGVEPVAPGGGPPAVAASVSGAGSSGGPQSSDHPLAAAPAPVAVVAAPLPAALAGLPLVLF